MNDIYRISWISPSWWPNEDCNCWEWRNCCSLRLRDSLYITYLLISLYLFGQICITKESGLLKKNSSLSRLESHIYPNKIYFSLNVTYTCSKEIRFETINTRFTGLRRTNDSAPLLSSTYRRSLIASHLLPRFSSRSRFNSPAGRIKRNVSEPSTWRSTWSRTVQNCCPILTIADERERRERMVRNSRLVDGRKINSETFARDSRTNRWANRRQCGTGWLRCYSLKDERSSIIPTQHRTYCAVTSTCYKTCPY